MGAVGTKNGCFWLYIKKLFLAASGKEISLLAVFWQLANTV
jgi:hypothetical protein